MATCYAYLLCILAMHTCYAYSLLAKQAEEASAIARQKRRAATLTPSPNPLLLPVTPNPINSKPNPTSNP